MPFNILQLSCHRTFSVHHIEALQIYRIMIQFCKGKTSFPRLVVLESKPCVRGGSVFCTVTPTINISCRNQVVFFFIINNSVSIPLVIIPHLYIDAQIPISCVLSSVTLQFLSLEDGVSRDVAPMLALCPMCCVCVSVVCERVT